MQLNLSPEAIQAIRAQMGLAPASAAEVQEQLNNVAPSLNQAPVLPSPGSSAWYRMQQENPGMLAQLEAERDAARAAASASPINANVTAAAGDRPPGVSQYVWDRVTNGTLAGLNPTSITNNPAVRDALIAAGYEDYVKGAYELHMDQNAGGMIQNGANADEAWDRAQGVGGGWYGENYGEYENSTVAGNASQDDNTLTFGHSSGPAVGTEEEPYVPPTVRPTDPPTNTGGGNGGGNGGVTVDLSPGAGAAAPVGERNRNYGVAQAGPMSGPVNTGIGTAGQNRATPFADAYVRAANRAQAEGPVTSLFKNFMQD